MLKRKLAGVAVALGVLTLGAEPALAWDDGPTFNISFYSDGTYTTQVGWARWECIPGPQAELQWGYATQYEVVDYVGECVDGHLQI